MKDADNVPGVLATFYNTLKEIAIVYIVLHFVIKHW